MAGMKIKTSYNWTNQKIQNGWEGNFWKEWQFKWKGTE